MSTIDEKNVDPIQAITYIAQTIMNVASWGFKESYQSAKPGKVIYESEWCRVSFIWGGWDYGGGNSINILYGRLHAPNDRATMIWNGEECQCWHRDELALHFLDKRTPVEAAKSIYSHFLTTPFYDKEFLQKYYRRQPEWLAQVHLAVWKHYGTRLFELFDLRQPTLWQQYQQFVKEVYDIEGRIPEIRPPLDKVC